MESGGQVVVGVNRFQAEEERPIPVLRVDPALEQAQVERVRQVRATRDAVGASEALKALERAARGSENLMPFILTAVEAYCTVGEISDTLRRVFGEYRETVIV